MVGRRGSIAKAGKLNMEDNQCKRPRITIFLLKHLLLPYECEEKLGDFDEVFLREVQEKGAWRHPAPD